MKYRITNDKELDAFFNKHINELGHTCHSIKAPPPPGATYPDGKPIINGINVEWVCSCGESCKIIREPDPENTCICYACATAEHNGGDGQCACDAIPVFNETRCGSCKHKGACDVALNPQLYPERTP